MPDKSKTLICPSCGNPLLYVIRESEADSGSQNTDESKNNSTESKTEKNEVIHCYSCGNDWFVKDIENRPAYNYGAASQAESAAFSGDAATVSYIDDSESAMAFLENYFGSFNWDDFMLTSEITVPTIDKIVEKLVVKKGSNSATWELQFTSIATPLSRKIKGLKSLEKKFFDIYVEKDDYTNGYMYLDAYTRIARKLVSSGDSIIKKLELAIKFFRKYDGAPYVAEALDTQLKRIKEDIAGIKSVDSFTELPGYKDAEDRKLERIVAELKTKGIEAESVYSKAVADYEQGLDRRMALAEFEKVKGYKSADKYANELNAQYEFKFKEGLLRRLGDKYYIQRMVVTPIFAPAAKGKEPEKIGEDKKINLYPIIDKIAQKEPVISDITTVLAIYAGHLVYIKSNKMLCIYDGGRGGEDAETVVLDSNEGDFCNPDGKINYFIKDKYLFIMEKIKAITEEKHGLFKKRTEVKISNKNNYSLTALDLSTGIPEVVVPELVDVYENKFGNQIFYTMVKTAEGSDKEEFYAYDIDKNESKPVLSANTEIVDVLNGKVLYFQWVPNDYNKDLYALDLTTGENKLLDRNIYEYYHTIEGKPYYFVGNASYRTLYSIDINDLSKREIMQNAVGIDDAQWLRNGWLYIIKGVKYRNSTRTLDANAALFKVSVDGRKNILLCTQFKKLIKFLDGYVYYLDSSDNLRVVREDGTENRIIVSGVQSVVHVSNDSVYFLKNEYIDVVDSSEKEYYSNSLYKVSLNGHNLVKLIFDVSAAEINSSNENEFYIYRTNTVKFKISVPLEKGEYDVSYENRELRSIAIYNIETGEISEVAGFGRPDFEPKAFKKGCLRKKNIYKDCIVEEVPVKIEYNRRGKMQAGAISNEQLAAAKAELEAKKNKKGCLK